jgi:propionyl-CoA carboxylase beta chain
MNSKHIGADLNLAWPTAMIAVMGAQGAINIIFRNEIREAPDPIQKAKELTRQYAEQCENPYIAASKGYVDAVIYPSETRVMLIKGLLTASAKRQVRPRRKHGNIPL